MLFTRQFYFAFCLLLVANIMAPSASAQSYYRPGPRLRVDGSDFQLVQNDGISATIDLVKHLSITFKEPQDKVLACRHYADGVGLVTRHGKSIKVEYYKRGLKPEKLCEQKFEMIGEIICLGADKRFVFTNGQSVCVVRPDDVVGFELLAKLPLSRRAYSARLNGSLLVLWQNLGESGAQIVSADLATRKSVLIWQSTNACFRDLFALDDKGFCAFVDNKVLIWHGLEQPMSKIVRPNPQKYLSFSEGTWEDTNLAGEAVSTHFERPFEIRLLYQKIDRRLLCMCTNGDLYDTDLPSIIKGDPPSKPILHHLNLVSIAYGDRAFLLGSAPANSNINATGDPVTAIYIQSGQKSIFKVADFQNENILDGL